MVLSHQPCSSEAVTSNPERPLKTRAPGSDLGSRGVSSAPKVKQSFLLGEKEEKGSLGR